jgi:hypothetical protein
MVGTTAVPMVDSTPIWTTSLTGYLSGMIPPLSQA